MFQKTITRLAILLALLVSFSLTNGNAQCNAEGGIISFTDGSNVKTIIVDGIPDPLEVVPDGSQVGTNAGWVITDLNLNILGLPAAPPFDLDGAGTGECIIWHIRFEDGLMGAVVGNNASDLMGCFSLSNPLTVERKGVNDVNGGNIVFNGGTTSESICIDGTPDPLGVDVDGTANGDSQAWVITDTQGNILGLPAAPPFDLDGAGPGTCLIWYLSFNGQLTGAAVGNNAANLMGDFDLSNPLTVIRNQVDGGAIAFTNGATTTTIIVDGTPDPLAVVPDGNQAGTNAGWVITDLDGNILGLPQGPPFDLDGAGTGNCLIWHIRFEDGLMGAAVGNNAADLIGCFDLSNPLTVERKAPTEVSGGNIEFDGGSTSETICVDGNPDPLDVTVDASTVVGDSQAWVITDTQGNILGLPAAPPFDLDGAGPGTCLIWYLSFNGQLTGAAVGNNAANLMGDFDLSNPLTVIRNQVDGGAIAFTNGATTTTIIVDGTPDPLAVVPDGNQAGTNAGWVITDLDGNILGLPQGPPFDLDGAGTGNCLIWHIRFEDGLMGAAVGNNAADLIGCFDLSNPLTVERKAPTEVSGGNIEFDGGSTSETICVDGNPDPLGVTVDASTVVGDSQAWVITDAQGNILGLPAAPPFDLDGAGPGTCLIWYLSFNGQLTGAAVGNNAANLMGDFDLSNPLTVIRNQVDGGNITFDNGSTSETIIIDGIPDPLNVILDGSAVGTNSAWVITDTQGNILGLPAAPPFDLDGAGVGTCLIWYLRFEDGLTGAAVGNNASDLVGCFDLSNPLTVDRIPSGSGEVQSGPISMPNGQTTRYTCPGNDPLITVELDFTVTLGNIAYVVTDDNFDIIGIQNDNMIDASGAPPGTCYIFAFNYTGNLTGMVGDRVFNTQFSDDSWLISSNAIRVIREAPEGGTITAKSGANTVYTCIDGNDDFIGFEPTGEGNANFVYVITDDDNNILGLNDRGFENFEGAPVGTCRVWGLSYTGSIIAQVGDNAAMVDLTDRCWDLSDNFITVIRERVEGGNLLSNGSERASASASNPVVSYATNSTSSAAYAHFILNRAQRIVAITFDQSFDFSTLAGEEVYYIYGMSHNGNVLLSVGDSFWGRQVTDGCFERSDNAVVVSYDASARPFHFSASPVGQGQLSLKLETEVVNLTADRITLRITDAFGRVVFFEDGIDAGNLENRILQLSNVVPGVHFISVQQNHMLVTERVVMP